MMNFLDSTPEPKPCPECGANPYSHEPSERVVNCKCSNCGLEGPTVSSDFSYKPSIREMEKVAVEQWNEYIAN